MESAALALRREIFRLKIWLKKSFSFATACILTATAEVVLKAYPEPKPDSDAWM